MKNTQTQKLIVKCLFDLQTVFGWQPKMIRNLFENIALIDFPILPRALTVASLCAFFLNKVMEKLTQALISPIKIFDCN